MTRDAERWTEVLQCPEAGRRWLLDYPQSELHGGGPVRLRTFDRVCRDLKVELNAAPDLLADPAARRLGEQLADVLGECWYPPRRP